MMPSTAINLLNFFLILLISIRRLRNRVFKHFTYRFGMNVSLNKNLNILNHKIHGRQEIEEDAQIK
jgi:hypothetical protein